MEYRWLTGALGLQEGEGGDHYKRVAGWSGSGIHGREQDR